jgi:hypothetical protein
VCPDYTWREPGDHAACGADGGCWSSVIADPTLVSPAGSVLGGISSLIVMQSTLAAAAPISVKRFAGTALGTLIGLIGSYFPANTLAFVLFLFLIGLVCAQFGVQPQRASFREYYAGDRHVAEASAEPVGYCGASLYRSVDWNRGWADHFRSLAGAAEKRFRRGTRK